VWFGEEGELLDLSWPVWFGEEEGELLDLSRPVWFGEEEGELLDLSWPVWFGEEEGELLDLSWPVWCSTAWGPLETLASLAHTVCPPANQNVIFFLLLHCVNDLSTDFTFEFDLKTDWNQSVQVKYTPDSNKIL
jgi:hypothetical protein